MTDVAYDDTNGPLSQRVVLGTPEFPVSEVPLQEIVERVAKGIYKAKPAAVFSFDEIREAQRLMESGKANGKIIVVKVRATGTTATGA